VKAIVTDADALRAVSPEDATAYLRAHGWDRTRERRTGSVWTRSLKGSAGLATVFVPGDRDFADYAQRLSELLGALAEVEERSQLEILADLTSASSDVIRIRVISAATAAGRIPLSTGVKVVEGARSLIMAAYCSARDPQPVYDFRHAVDARRHVDEFLLGSEAPSSYAISIVSPLGLDLPVSGLQPFSRTVTRTLFRAMDRLQTLVRDVMTQRGDLSQFSQQVRSGVSSNLCEAIASMDIGQPDGVVEFAFSWSPLHRDPDLTPRRFAIRQGELPLVRRAAEFLKEAEPRPSFQVEGPVVRLDRPTGAGTSGIVTIRAVVDNSQALVHARLEPQQYDIAGSAHLRAQRVRVMGLLVRRRGRATEYDLLEVSDIAIAPSAGGTETASV
jgi:hypothetical protein